MKFDQDPPWSGSTGPRIARPWKRSSYGAARQGDGPEDGPGRGGW